MRPIIIGVLLVMLLAGCGSSNSTDSSTDTVLADPSGIWLGTQTVLEKDAVGNVYSNAFDMKTLIYDGRFYGISEDANILFYGTYQLGTDGQMIIDGLEGGENKYQMYSLDSGGESWVNGVARLQLTEKETFTGMFQNDAFQEGELQSHYSALYEKGASLDNLSGRYDTFDIDPSGIISGLKNNCSVTGTVSVPDPTFNMYSLTYKLEGENCTKAGSYSGLGTIAIDPQNQAYFMALSNSSDDTRMDGIYISLETPLSFVIARIDKNLSTFIGLAQGERISTKVRTALNIENWPDLVTPALADLSSFIQNMNPKDATNKDFVDLADIVYSASLTSSDGSANEVFYTIENTDFSGSSFNGVKFSLINEIPFGGNDNFYYDGFFVSLFDGADLRNVGFYGLVAQNSFVNANLEGSNWDRVYQNNWNDFSGAWWMDGHRCGIDLYLNAHPDEDSGCTENYIDSGLTYEEWKSGKWEAEKVAENIGNKLKDIGSEGEKFVEEPLKTVGKWTGFW